MLLGCVGHWFNGVLMCGAPLTLAAAATRLSNAVVLIEILSGDPITIGGYSVDDVWCAVGRPLRRGSS